MDVAEYTIFLFASFITAIFSFIMAVMAFNLKARGAIAFGFLSSLISLWCFAIGGKMLSATETIASVWAYGIAFAGSFAPPMFLVFAWYYANPKKNPSRLKMIIVFLEPIIAVAIFSIPSLSSLYIQQFFYTEVMGNLVTIGMKIGPYYWIHLFFSAMYIVAGDVVILRRAMDWSKRSRTKVILLALATSIPILTALIRATNVFPNVNGNIDVFGFAVATMIGGAVIYYFEILEFQPIPGRQLMEELPDPLIVFDQNGCIIDRNSSALVYFADPMKEDVKSQFVSFLQDEDLLEGRHIQKKLSILHQGADCHFEVHLSPIRQASRVIGYQMFLRDVTALTDSLEKLELLATTDPLTGLHNRRYFTLQGDQIYDQSIRYQRPFSLLAFDVDLFKSINDSYGHPVGDEVLKHIAVLLQSTTRKVDIVARFGGDEFFILMPESTAEMAKNLAERIQEAFIAQPCMVADHRIQVNFSFGVASVHPGTNEQNVPSLEELMREADIKLYEAKSAGRNQVCTAVF